MTERRYRSGAEKRAAAEARKERRAAVEDPEVVMEAAAAFLAVRPRSVAETRKRLQQLGYQEAIVDGVVERLVELGYLDDGEFARAWVESRDRVRPRGETALRRELHLKGIERDVLDGVLAERAEAAPHDGAADREAATRLLERKRAPLLREPDRRKRRQKAYALLARNGFDPDVCREAASAFEAALARSQGASP